jgi:hypothetical protein
MSNTDTIMQRKCNGSIGLCVCYETINLFNLCNLTDNTSVVYRLASMHAFSDLGAELRRTGELM